MSNHPHIATFVHECEDLLMQLEDATLGLGNGDPEILHLTFRIFHTIKGSAAMVGLTQMSGFTHHVESVLDLARNGIVDVTPALVNAVLAAKDHIAVLLMAAIGEPADDADAGAAILAQLAELAGAAHAPEPVIAEAQEPIRRVVLAVRARPGVEVARASVAAVVEELTALGTCELADAADGWSIACVTRAPIDAVLDRFIFLETEAEVSHTTEPVWSDPDAGFVLFDDLEMTEQVDARAPIEVTPAPATPAPAKAAPVASAKPAPVASPKPAAAPAKAVSAAATKPDATVRVSFSKLDRLVDLVSELVISRSRLAEVAQRLRDPELDGAVEEIERLAGELRDGVLGTRMMPIAATFSRFKRLVHDLSTQLDKQVVLTTDGEDTELDKHMLDQLGDPLMHLVRNAVDHGIEPRDARAASGKPAFATVRLAAAHTGEFVAITITDDGRGLDVDAIRAKGIERGLIRDDAHLAPAELFRLIFEPGFSTARQISDVSGRGVGMDVVKRQVEALRGTIAITSERGVGTTITLRLPVTLAIIDGLVVQAAGERYIVPLSSVTETIELPRGDRERYNGRCAVVVRDELVPYVSLRDTFGATDLPPRNEKVVIIQDGDDRIGIVVDRVLGNHQTVIQSLGRLYRGVNVTAGATIMGDGRIALILDVAGVRRLLHPAGATIAHA
ncbi:MAG: chemotaxis protein CheA [Deltaproteobacteria bacterium]|nr:chemotaxis protein CheA [Deltaproteobacteria bacterium]